MGVALKTLNDCFRNCFLPSQSLLLSKIREHIGECEILYYTERMIHIHIEDNDYSFEIEKSSNGIPIIRNIVAL